MVNIVQYKDWKVWIEADVNTDTNAKRQIENTKVLQLDIITTEINP